MGFFVHNPFYGNKQGANRCNGCDPLGVLAPLLALAPLKGSNGYPCFKKQKEDQFLWIYNLLVLILVHLRPGIPRIHQRIQLAIQILIKKCCSFKNIDEHWIVDSRRIMFNFYIFLA